MKYRQEFIGSMKFMVRIFCIFIFIAFNNSALADWGDDIIMTDSASMDKENITDLTFRKRSDSREGGGLYMFYTCLSSDICPVTQGGWQNKGETPVKVKFRSSQGVTKILILQGSESGYGCSGTLMHLNSPAGCNSSQSNIVFKINQSEIRKLDFGSIWKMEELILNICKWGNGCAGYGKVIVNITINLTDKNNAQIYIPSSGSSTANVNLKLETYNSQYLKGEQSIGICVYDGHDSTRGSLFDMSMAGTINSKNEFAIVHDNGDEIPIDMFVTFPDGEGNIILPSRSFSYSTKGHDSVVMGLPGVDTPVYCIPMDINFKVSPFLKNNKSSGVYNGSFNLKFNATLY